MITAWKVLQWISVLGFGVIVVFLAMGLTLLIAEPFTEMILKLKKQLRNKEKIL